MTHGAKVFSSDAFSLRNGKLQTYNVLVVNTELACMKLYTCRELQSYIWDPRIQSILRAFRRTLVEFGTIQEES